MRNNIKNPLWSIICKDIELSYSHRKIFSLPDFTLSSGEKIVLSGPSWSGKTSFLHMLAWLIYPDKWSITYRHEDRAVLTTSRAFSLLRREHIGMTFSEPLFFEELNVEENIFFPHTFAGLTYDPEWQRRLFEELAITHLLHSQIALLSSGERDRINIIRALLYKSTILFLDEPGSHMDRALFEKFLVLLSDYLRETNPTLILVSHSEKFDHIVDRRYICENGTFLLLS